MGRLISNWAVLFGIIFCAGMAEAATRQFTIAGIVQTSEGIGVEGASVAGNNGATSVVTGVDGTYSVTVPNNWDGTISVSKSGWLITPVSKTYSKVRENITNENYVGYQPRISGYVKKADGTALAGATVSASGAETTATNANGYYEITVAYGWGGTVTATLSGYKFTAKSYSNVRVDQANQDFVGYQPKISGYVKKADGTALAGVSVSASGGASTTTNTSGYFEITVAYGWSGTVTASLAGYGFTAKSYSNVTTNQPNQNFAGYQPKISGHVKKADGTALAGATVSASGAETTATNASGYYELTVAYGWGGMVTATLTGYNFPAKSYSNVTTDQADQDFVGYQPKISGYVKKADGTALAGASVSASGSSSTTTNASGYYEITVAYGWSGTVTASLKKISFIAKYFSNVMADQSGIDFQGTYVGIIVKPDGTGDYPTIQAAIDAAVTGDIVSLQPGTYTGTGNRDIRFRGKAITVKGVTDDPNVYVIDCNNTVADKYAGFIFTNGDGPNSVLENVKIINLYYTFESGGAISCHNSSSPTIRNCIITNNRSIGICSWYGSEPNIINCTISSNSGSRAGGGGIYNSYSNPIIHSCNIQNNVSLADGAGIFNYESNPVIDKCTITGNSGDDGAGIYGRLSVLTITNCIICDNNATGYGGGIYNWDESDVLIDNCTINGNSSVSGGGIYSQDSTLNIEDTIISNNLASDSGGGIYTKHEYADIIDCNISNNTTARGGGIYVGISSSPTIRNCNINNNWASDSGGAIFNVYYNYPTIENCVISGNSSGNYGAAVYNSSGISNIRKCTITNNLASQYGGVFYSYVDSYDTGNSSNLSNCIIWGNQLWPIQGTATVKYCDVLGGHVGVGNINADPLFADGGFHLDVNSPCINAGDPNYVAGPNETDIDNAPRVTGGRIDMGADESVDFPMINIYGYVKRVDGNGLTGALITATNVSGNVVTDVNGFYAFTVPIGWIGTVSVELAGYSFIAKSYTSIRIDQANQDFVEYLPKISGYIKKADNTALSGAFVTASGGGSTTTNGSGYYEIVVAYGWSGTVTASLGGYNFATRNYTNVVTDQSNQNFTGFQPTISGYTNSKAGVTITVDGVGSVVSNASYYYSITVPYGWSGTVTAALDGYNFAESPKTYTTVTANMTSQNFTAFQPSVYGYVRNYSGSYLSSVTVTANGAGSTTTNSSGYYMMKVPYGWSGTLTASKSGYYFGEPVTVTNKTANWQQDFTEKRFKVCGFVKDKNGAGVSSVYLDGIGTYTSSTGYYEISNIAYNSITTITPSKTGYSFNPVSRNYSNLIVDVNDADFTAIQPWVSGTIRDVNGAGAGGVTVAAGTTATTTTDPNGRYVLKLSYNWSGTVTPVMEGYGFSPASRSYTSMKADSNEQDYVIGRTINLSKTSCAFTAYGKSGSSAGQTLLITTSGGVLNWRIEVPTGCDWLNVSPLSGQVSDGNSVVSITVDPNKAIYGSNSCQLKVVSDTAVNSPRTVSVSLYVYGPSIYITPRGGFSIQALPDEKFDKPFELKNGGYDVLHWTIQPDANCGWIKSVSPASGECGAGQSQTVNLQIDANGLADGSYTGQLRIVSPEVLSSVNLSIALTVHTPKVLYVPRDYPTITAAHNAAYTYGDTIVVEPGRYLGCDISKSLVIRSTAPEDPNVVAATVVTSGIREFNRDPAGYVKIQGLTFISELAYAQSAIDLRYSPNFEISNCVIKNWARGGIGIGNYGIPRTVLIKNCVIAGNCFAGIIISSNSSIDIVNCTIADTWVSGYVNTTAAGIEMWGSNNNRITITNSILSNRLVPGDKEVWFDSSSSTQTNYLSILNSCVPAGPNSIIAKDPNYLTVNYGPGNIESDPCFARAGRFDDNGTPADANDDMWIGGDYHLKSTAGRWEMNELIDMDGGADGAVNMLDLAVLAGEWGKTAKKTAIRNGYVYAYLRADLDNNGRVDINDLAILCQDYLYEYENGWWIYDDVSSPCIDGGDVNSDWSSEPLPNGGRINMGAYGGTRQASMSK